jgi:chemotaxis protein MotB
MKIDDFNPIMRNLRQSGKGDAQAALKADAYEPLLMANEGIAAIHQATSRYSVPPTQRLTLTNMESPYRKSQPAPIHWAVGWADLMMTMFVLFLVMYLYQSAQQRQMAEHGMAAAPLANTVQKAQSGQGERTTQPEVKSDNGGQSEMERQVAEGKSPVTGTIDDPPDRNKMEMTRLYDLAILTLKDDDLAKFADIELSPDRTVRIVLAADLLFPSGNADLGSTARGKIQKIASLLKKTPYMINVVGHTDNVSIKSGPFATNWELSVMRATTVARFLIEEMGIPASQFSVSGHSYHRPQVNNDTPANRAKNRRVEIIVSREQQPSIPMAANPSLL